MVAVTKVLIKKWYQVSPLPLPSPWTHAWILGGSGAAGKTWKSCCLYRNLYKTVGCWAALLCRLFYESVQGEREEPLQWTSDHQQQADRWVAVPHRSTGVQGCLQNSTRACHTGTYPEEGHTCSNWQRCLDRSSTAHRATIWTLCCWGPARAQAAEATTKEETRKGLPLLTRMFHLTRASCWTRFHSMYVFSRVSEWGSLWTTPTPTQCCRWCAHWQEETVSMPCTEGRC